MDLLREYVDNRCFKCTEKFQSFKTIKPKTVIVSTKDNAPPKNIQTDGVISVAKRTAEIISVEEYYQMADSNLEAVAQVNDLQSLQAVDLTGGSPRSARPRKSPRT